MTAPRESAGRQLLSGGTAVLAADALHLPCALLLAAYLSRTLGVEGLALYLVAASLVTAVELVVGVLFSRATVQLVSEEVDWQPVASLVLRWHGGLGLAAGALLAAGTAAAEHPLGVPGLRGVLLVFALEVPLFAVARAHTHVLVGRGLYRERALAAAARWLGRLGLSVAFVAAGLSVVGAALGAVASTAVELIVARRFVRPAWRTPAPAGLRARLWRTSSPLFVHGLSLQLVQRLALLVLVPFGGTVAAAGLYGAAESVLRVRRVLGQSLTPLLLSSLTRLQRDGATEEARALARNALRAVFFSVPPVAALAGAGPALMVWLFGPEFRAGGGLLAVLAWSIPGFLALSIATALLVSGGRPGGPARLTLPMVPLGLLGFALVIPTHGALGAAGVTTGLFLATGAAGLAAVRSLWGLVPPPLTVARAVVAGALAWSLARSAPLGGWWLVLELPAAAVLGGAAFLLLGEVGLADLRRGLREVRRRARRRPARAEETGS